MWQGALADLLAVVLHDTDTANGKQIQDSL
jgi:hypothetical protein